MLKKAASLFEKAAIQCQILNHYFDAAQCFRYSAYIYNELDYKPEAIEMYKNAFNLYTAARDSKSAQKCIH